MARRTLTKFEKTEKRIKEINFVLDGAIKAAKKILKEGKELHKLQGLMTSIGISLDQLVKLAREQKEVPVEDLTAKWSDETTKRFLKWLETEGLGWLLYLNIIKNHPEILEKILKTEEMVKKEITVEQLTEGIVKDYCRKHGLELKKLEE